MTLAKKPSPDDVGAFLFCGDIKVTVMIKIVMIIIVILMIMYHNSIFHNSNKVSNLSKKADNKKSFTATEDVTKEDENDYGVVSTLEPPKETDNNASTISERNDLLKEYVDKIKDDHEAVPSYEQRVTSGQFETTNEFRKPSNIFIEKVGKIVQSKKIRHSLASGWVYDVNYFHDSKGPMDYRHRAAEKLMRSSILFFAKLDKINGGKSKKKPTTLIQYKNGIQCINYIRKINSYNTRFF